MSDDGPVYGKFHVERTDGRDQPGGPHEGCAYFVLDYTHDPYAREALEAYADACEPTHPTLASDLRERLQRERDDDPFRGDAKEAS